MLSCVRRSPGRECCRGLCSCAGGGRWVRGCTWSLSACCPAGCLVAWRPEAECELSPPPPRPVHPRKEATLRPRGVVALRSGLGLALLPLASLLLSPGVSSHPHLQGFPISSISFSDQVPGALRALSSRSDLSSSGRSGGTRSGPEGDLWRRGSRAAKGGEEVPGQS